jgi:hypothetical protein
MKLGKPEDVSFLKGLIFGPPKHGKTYTLGTLADDERTAPVLFLDFEGGAQTLVGRDMTVGRVRDWQDIEEAYDILDDPDSEYKSWAVDSLSETQIAGLLKILEKDKHRADPDQLSQPDWGLILVQMRRFVRSFVNLDMHGLMSALSKDDLDPHEGKIVVPLFQGAFANEVAGIFDVIGYLALSENDEGETERLLLLHDYPKFRIGARAPMGVEVPSEIVNPTAGKLLDALGYAKKPAKKAGNKEA